VTTLTLRPLTEDSLFFVESPLEQAEGEERLYKFDTTSYGGTPTNATVSVLNLSTLKDVSAVVIPETTPTPPAEPVQEQPVIVGNIITLPLLSGMLKRNKYSVKTCFTIGTEVLNRYFIISVRN
jgi:hypothetical protein